jgi:HK97 family phage portal protein
MGFLTKLLGIEQQPLSIVPQDIKKAFQLNQVGVTGRAEPLAVNRERLDFISRRNEVAYACVEKKKQAAIDPTPVIEKAVGDEWERVQGHPLSRLLMRPNPLEDGASFWGNWIASEDIFGEAYAEIERNAMGQPVRLWRLNPLFIKPVAGKGKDGSPVRAYEYTMGGYTVTLRAEDVLVRRKTDLTNSFFGLSPLLIASSACDMDLALTDFTRALFNNGGVPSGILNYLDGELKETEAEAVRQKFNSKYGRGGRGQGGVVVLDTRMEYQKVGVNVGEYSSQELKIEAETRICMVFGVPPLLIGALAGLVHSNTRAGQEETQKEFWTNTMSPLFKSLRIFLTWNLLPEFSAIELIEAEKIRVNWDMSQVMALQEDTDKRHDRARKNMEAGGITLNEFRAVIGEAPDPQGDYYIRKSIVIGKTPEVAFEEAEQVAQGKDELDAEIIEDEKGRILSDLRKTLMQQDGTLAPPLKVYKDLQAHVDEDEANRLVADVVAEVQKESA